MSENQQTQCKELFTQDYVHHRLLVSKYTAIKWLLYGYLSNAISICTKSYKVKYIENKKSLLYKDRDDKRVLYISGMALWLSKSQNQKTMELAHAIASHLSVASGDVFSIQIVPPGWIHLELTHPSLAVWLQSLAVEYSGRDEESGRCRESKMKEVGDGEKYLIPKKDSKFPNSLFFVQYVHARCCSLVLLAHQEGLIKLKEPVPDYSPAFWSFISSNPIPWLNCDGKLRLNHPDERRLIAELVQAVDSIKCPNVSNYLKWQKAALNLSRAFENFWCNCRIWGEVKITSLELAQARLGLLMATQSVLRFLLEEKLGVFAPLEL
ncbi:MAG: glutamate acetyltransferase [Komarekiella atlantica HA4396-MV6]|jgi:arginyl-tRNA synthetase|nr:glutamate acetyltransferase [Komarekiella atlantica HA4396-MV6]